MPSATLSTLSGEPVEIVVPSGDTAIILYCLGASESPEPLDELNAVVALVPEVSAFGLIAKSAGQQEIPVKETGFPPNILLDNKNVISTFGLSRNHSAAVIIGPRNILLDIVREPQGAREVCLAACDVFLANGLYREARHLYQAMPEDWLSDRDSVSLAYAAIFNGESEAARDILDSLQGKAQLSAEVNTAMAYLLYEEGNLRQALDRCQAAGNEGFSRWIHGMILSRAGECTPAAAAFEKAMKYPFQHRWQKGATLNMAAWTAESKGNSELALSLYKQAFAVGPLNTTTAANLMNHYWEQEKKPNAAAYATALRASRISNPLARSLLVEFEGEMTFLESSSTDKLLSDNAVKTARQRKPPAGAKTLLVADFSILGCPLEMNWIDCAAGGLLKSYLEQERTLVAIRRSEIKKAAQALRAPERDLSDPVRLKEIASALSADYLVLGEIGTYKDAYLMNVRVADVKTGEMAAVASERFSTVNAAASAIEKAAAELIKQLKRE